MCRWLAYYGSPILLDELLYKPEHSLIDQSKHARMGVETLNGDGVGIGWYPELLRGTDREEVTPALFRSIGPAWGETNLRELADHVRSPLFFAHIRASTGTAVQQTNCHPFRHGRWLWMHNGAISHLSQLKRDLLLAVEPALLPEIQGSTDSELMFYLALTFGLEEDPRAAVARMICHVEETAAKHGVENPLQMTVATSDGERVWAFRYSTERHSRSLFFSSAPETLARMYPEIPMFANLSPETRVVVSEPLGGLAGAWNEVPEWSCGVIQPGQDELLPLGPFLDAARR
ncbi:class II glutamine amidotransferase [Actinospica sp. MGRD01-02]|uniref:Class II glutamine amidotransferase n=1 Tax=Actinospica acidithermotolerans TaxID=2828514 RepID=A0A941IMA6_9ACTN|nr:class II glutamine amidotransferase [Actinospica acidithermotolerans]MBR7830877.1 class II glutamine amidotransferase [Actinospica acidithermotolerans]